MDAPRNKRPRTDDASCQSENDSIAWPETPRFPIHHNYAQQQHHHHRHQRLPGVMPSFVQPRHRPWQQQSVWQEQPFFPASTFYHPNMSHHTTSGESAAMYQIHRDNYAAQQSGFQHQRIPMTAMQNTDAALPALNPSTSAIIQSQVALSVATPLDSSAQSRWNNTQQLPNTPHGPYGDCYATGLSQGVEHHSDNDMMIRAEVEEELPNPMVCYGMVDEISGKLVNGSCDRQQGQHQPGEFQVKLESDHQFIAVDDAELCGTIEAKFVDIVSQLRGEPSLRLQAACSPADSQLQLGAKPSRHGGILVSCTLSIIIYGPLSTMDSVGEFFQEVDMYLQDPRGCDVDVKYCNPHCISWSTLDDCPMTSELASSNGAYMTSTFEAPLLESSFLEMLDSHQQLSEAPQPENILTPLKRHQRQALEFLLQREAGWNFDPRSPDFWDSIQTSDLSWVFVNKVSGISSLTEPPEMRGGIVADPMGLGKTLTMISLILTQRPRHCNNRLPSKVSSNTMPTLVVVPPPLLDTWEEQLSLHVKKGVVKWRRHHGKEKLGEVDDLSQYAIVITTYHTLALDWPYKLSGRPSVLFSTTWKRVILDEAHFIRNPQSQMSKAVCAVNAKVRWAVTGTPIQNRVADLAALLKFIRAYPYHESRQFEIDIAELWRRNEVEKAAKRLKILSRGLILRRPKAVIDLPPRQDLKRPVEFYPSERKFYEHLRQQTIANFDAAFSHQDDESTVPSYITVIQKINALRIVCNLGLHYHSRHGLAAIEGVSSEGVDAWTSCEAQQAFNLQRELDSVHCVQCLGFHDAPMAALDPEPQARPVFASCLTYICGDCVQRKNFNRPLTCGHNPAHTMAPISLKLGAPDEDLVLTNVAASINTLQVSSKVAALVSQIQSLPSGVKCVVFSSWRMTLDLVEIGLQQAGISHVRFDGKVEQRHRSAVIEKFKKDSTIQVFLLTLSCGAAGLTLTEATHAYLIEPHWNPTVEEQALARVHRLGQQKEVTTIRFFMRDTFEERIIQVQEDKRNLEKLLLAPKEDGGSNSLGVLESLRRLV